MMMSKKKSNCWARLKLILLLPAAALCMYAFARPEVTRQLAQMIRIEETTTAPNNQKYTPEFFEAELNKYISELGGNATLSANEKSNFLREKTNIVSIFINSKDAILFISARDKGAYSKGSLVAIEELSRLLTNELIAEYQNKKPVLFFMQYDRGASAELINQIFQIVGKVFADNQELLSRKKQPVLLLLGEPKRYGQQNQKTASIFAKPTETQTVQIAFSSHIARSFTLKIDDSFELDKDTAEELKEWLKSQKIDDTQYKTVYIKASSEVPMGVIIDIKQILRDYFSLKVTYALL